MKVGSVKIQAEAGGGVGGSERDKLGRT
jgi:hypothetical protein